MVSPRLKPLFDDYASVHRDLANQRCHMLGIPMIMVGLFGLLAQLLFWEPTLVLRLDGGSVLWILTLPWFLFMDWRLGGPFALVAFGIYLIGRIASFPVLIALFATGWAIQLVGHSRFEKKSPAFLQNFTHLLVGPLWLFAKLIRLET